jgi:plasmid stabilization system protein ParE
VTLPATTSPEADAQIRTIDDWWRENRPASPNLFFDELPRIDLIAHAPNIGRLYRRSPIVGTRRVLLRGSHHHVYYVSGEREVRILAVWHCERGTGPPLTTQP